MPSLRRPLSSHSVRSSPYPPAMGPSASHRHRRSSGKETASRRVLADLEWWSVADGQCDIDAEQATDDHDQDTFPFILDGLRRPSTPVLGVSENTRFSVSPQTPLSPIPFPTLSFMPQTPTRGTHDSPSVESSPESITLPRPRITFADVDLDATFFTALPSFNRKKRVPSLTSNRGSWFTDPFSYHLDAAEPYDGLPDLSGSPFSHLKLLV